MLAEWFQLLNSMFVNDIFGSKLLFGIFLVGVAGYYAFKSGMNFSSFGITLGFLVLLLVGAGYLPDWLKFGFGFIVLFIIALAMLRVGNRR